MTTNSRGLTRKSRAISTRALKMPRESSLLERGAISSRLLGLATLEPGVLIRLLGVRPVPRPRVAVVLPLAVVLLLVVPAFLP